MMPSPLKGRARVAVQVAIGGIPTRILAAQDRGEKGVIFSPYAAVNLELDGRSIPIREEHVSVWPNKASGKSHVHHTYHLNDHEFWKVDHSTLVSATKDDFATAILALSVPKRIDRQPASFNTAKYLLSSIPSYDERDCVLLVCYVAADLLHTLPCLEDKGIALADFTFSTVRLGLYYTYLNIPSYPRARTSHITTSTRRINNGKTLHFGGSDPHPSFVIHDLVVMHMQGLIAGHMNVICQDATEYDPEEGRQTVEFFHGYNILNTKKPLALLESEGTRYIYTLNGPFIRNA